MPNDLVTLKALAGEMNFLLTQGKIDKIGMPSGDEALLVVRARGVNRALYLSARSDSPRVHFTSLRFPNTPTPPNFCMLLRKHVLGGTIENVKVLNEDRLFEFTICARNELNDATTFRLIIEIMGGASNIILLKDDYTIIDAVKRVMNLESRVVFPGAKYTYPTKSKALLSSVEDVEKAVESENPKEVYSKINGLSKESALELIVQSKIEGAEKASARLNDLYAHSEFCPVAEYDENGKVPGNYIY